MVTIATGCCFLRGVIIGSFVAGTTEQDVENARILFGITNDIMVYWNKDVVCFTIFVLFCVCFFFVFSCGAYA